MLFGFISCEQSIHVLLSSFTIIIRHSLKLFIFFCSLSFFSLSSFHQSIKLLFSSVVHIIIIIFKIRALLWSILIRIYLSVSNLFYFSFQVTYLFFIFGALSCKLFMKTISSFFKFCWTCFNITAFRGIFISYFYIGFSRSCNFFCNRCIFSGCCGVRACRLWNIYNIFYLFF